jgi:outer membrane biosynthesis protein TonB
LLRHGPELLLRDVRMLTHAASGDINRAVLLALSQWTFEPGMLDGKPVDVVFDLTVNFKLN